MGYALAHLAPSVFLLMGAVAIYLSILSLIILGLSLWGVKSLRSLGYMGVFLLCMGIASLAYLGYGILVVIDIDRLVRPTQYLVTVSDSLYEFGFSIVNLTLKDLSSMLKVRNTALEYLWLIFNIVVFAINILITVLQQGLNTEPRQVLFWNSLFSWAMQIVNLVVFFYYRQKTMESLAANSITESSSQMLSAVMARFTEYCLIYALYVMSFFWVALGTLLDITDSWNLTAAVFSYFGFGTHQTMRFMAFVYALKIYRPWWCRWMEVTKTAYTAKTNATEQPQQPARTDDSAKRHSLPAAIRPVVQSIVQPFRRHSSQVSDPEPIAALQTDALPSSQPNADSPLGEGVGAGGAPDYGSSANLSNNADPPAQGDQSEQPHVDDETEARRDELSHYNSFPRMGRRFTLQGVEPSMYTPASMVELPRISEQTEELGSSHSFGRWLRSSTRASTNNRKSRGTAK